MVRFIALALACCLCTAASAASIFDSLVFYDGVDRTAADFSTQAVAIVKIKPEASLGGG